MSITVVKNHREYNEPFYNYFLISNVGELANLPTSLTSPKTSIGSEAEIETTGVVYKLSNLNTWIPKIGTSDIKTAIEAVETAVDNVTDSLTPTRITGTAQSGAYGMLIDNTKDFDTANVIGSTIALTIDGVTYYRDILDTVEDQVIFSPLPLGTAASVLIAGSGDGAYTGELTIRIKEFGLSGNDYSLILVDGTGVSATESIALVSNVLTITSGTDAGGVPTPLAAGNIQTMVQNTPAISAIFDASGEFTAGAIETFAEAVPFLGGIDGIPVVNGVSYFIFSDVNDVMLKSGSSIIGKVSIDQVTAHANEVVVKAVGTTLTHAEILVGVISTVVLAANSSRKYALIINDSDTTIYLKIGTDAALNSGIRLNANGGSYEMSSINGNLDLRVINAISSVAGKNLIITEGV